MNVEVMDDSIKFYCKLGWDDHSEEKSFKTCLYLTIQSGPRDSTSVFLS